MGELAKFEGMRRDHDWPEERLALIRKTICHQSMSEAEILMFLEQCRRTDSDPLLGEAFCVPRWVSVKGKHGEDLGTQEKYCFQMSEEGMASRCARFPDYKGIRFGLIFEKEPIKIDPWTNEVSTIMEPNRMDRGNLIGAWAVVDRDGFHNSPEILYLHEYIQRKKDGSPTKSWGDKKATMILKCARAAARRRAYSSAFSGVYATEEMQFEREADAENAANATAPTGPVMPGRSKGDEIAEKMKSKLATLRPQMPASTGAQTVEGTVAARAEPEKVAAKPTPPKGGAEKAVGAVERRIAAFLDQEEVKKGSKLTRDEEKKLTEQFLARETKTAAGQITNSDMDRAGPPPVDESTAADDGSPRLSFGPPSIKGKQIGPMGTDDLIGAASVYDEILAQATGDEPSLPKLKYELEAIEAELKKREAEQ